VERNTVGRNGCYVAGIREQTEQEEKRTIPEGSERGFFSDMRVREGRRRRYLLKESLGIVMVITTSVITVH
jgi:hypothetical protein